MRHTDQSDRVIPFHPRAQAARDRGVLGQDALAALFLTAAGVFALLSLAAYGLGWMAIVAFVVGA